MIRSNRESGANHAARANHPGNYHQPKSRQLMKNQIYDQKYFKVLPNSPNFYFFTCVSHVGAYFRLSSRLL